MPFVSYEEDEFVGRYGVVQKEMPVNEGEVKVKSVVRIDSCYKDGEIITYAMTDAETGAKFTVPKTVSEQCVFVAPFFDEHYEDITPEGVHFFAQRYWIEIVSSKLSRSMFADWSFKRAVRKLENKTLKLYSKNR